MTQTKNKARILAIILVICMVVGVLGASIASFAATATVNGTNVNVRESASTGAAVVGTVNTGESFEVGDPETGSDGRQWYKVTLSNGNSGYIREDLLTVSQDAATSAEPAASEPEPAPAEEPQPSQTGTETPAQDSSSEKYQLVNVPDANGNEVWYVYDYVDGLRIKVEDLTQYDTIKSNADTYERSAGRFRTMAILFGVLFGLALAGLAYTLYRLREALSTEVDIAENRGGRKPRGGHGTVNGTTRPGGRRQPYASGQGGTGQGRTGAGRPQGDGSARRPQQPQGGTKPGIRPGQAVRQGTTQARNAAGQAVRTTADGAKQTMHTVAEGAERAADRIPVVSAPRPEGGQPVMDDKTIVRAPGQSAAPKNFAVDDDMDYGFLNKKD